MKQLSGRRDFDMTTYEILQKFYSGDGLNISSQDKISGMQYIRRYIACDYPDIAQEFNLYNTPAKAAANIFAILLMSGTKMPSYLKFSGNTIDFENRKNLINAFEASYKDIVLLSIISPDTFSKCIESFNDIELKKKNRK